MSLIFAKSFAFIVVCALLCTGCVLCWLIGGFFDAD
jgi:hypothetical protein